MIYWKQIVIQILKPNEGLKCEYIFFIHKLGQIIIFTKVQFGHRNNPKKLLLGS